MAYTPPERILKRYADLLVNFALNGGKGIKKGEVVFLQIPECAKPILLPLRESVLKAGGFPIIEYLPDDVARHFYENASEDQLLFFPEFYLKGKVEQADHFLHIIAETDKHELETIDPKKIMVRSKAWKPYKDWRDEKENAGKLTWTLGLYGTEAMAKEVSLSLEDYWEQITKACYLDDENPVETWRGIEKQISEIKEKLNNLKIEKLHLVSKDTDLMVKIGKNRKWLGGSGRNIPSFEVFISPDWRGTEGVIQFNQPLYRYGNLIKNVRLVFKEGCVVECSASQGEEVLKEMVATVGAEKVGEFSLTDSRLSRITKFMGETLYDENVGGVNGNTHIALGSAYKDTFPGDPSVVTKEQWDEMGYNDSVVHTDIISTENRKVTAYLEDGTKKVIYENGVFTL
ncbi:MAG: aminopeptidase [Nanoarchaeota archaeon]|nr:aminopeptidase [Nanoarchaeota archaeon]